MEDSNDILVGVLSDTHGRFFSALYEALAECDHIIHAGDIGNPHILRDLKTLAPVTAVLGNNDFDEYGSSVTQYALPEIAKVRFLISHYPQAVYLQGSAKKLYPAGKPLPHVCIHGHTHVPRLVTGKEASPADYVLCPGSPTYPRGGSTPSIAKISIKKGRVYEVLFEEV